MEEKGAKFGALQTIFEAAFYGATGRASFICNEKEEQCCSNGSKEGLAVHGWLERAISQRCYSEVNCEIWTFSECKNLERVWGLNNRYCSRVRVIQKRSR